MRTQSIKCVSAFAVLPFSHNRSFGRLDLFVACLSLVIMLMAIEGRAGAQPLTQLSYGGFHATPEAVNLFNQGTALLRSNRSEEAISKFERACSLSANFAEAHHEWAVALLKLGRVNDAIGQFNQAIKLDPSLAASWLSLAGAYQSAGQVSEAITAYKTFLMKFPHDDDVGRVGNLIAMLEKENAEPILPATGQTEPSRQAEVGSLTKSGDVGQMNPSILTQKPAGDDYLAAVTRNGKIRWPAQRMPLHVFIQRGDLIGGYRPAFAVILKDAFLQWADASGKLVSFVFVDAAANADIVCRWTANTAKFKNSAESAETKLYSDQYGVAKGEMEILTMLPISSPPLTDERMRQTALHEVGHVLGLAGHTHNPADIMFFSSSSTDSPKDLSVQDKNTIMRLYIEK